jgi:hypothetical protein
MGLRSSAGPDYAFDALAVLRIVFVFGFTLTFYPVVKAFTLGQIQLWINSIFAAVLLLFVVGYRSASGILIGVICLMKPHYGLFALWGLLNREWRFTAALMVTGAAGLALSIFYYGWLNHLDYLRVLSFMSERGESYYANQSINGLLNRLASLGAPERYANVKFDAYGFPPYTPWVYWMTLLSSAIILLTAFLRRSDTASRAFAFAIVGLSLAIASPIAWEHHYGVFLPVFAFTVGVMARHSGRLVLLAASYPLVGHFVPAANLLAHTPFNVLQSYMLAGGLVLLVLMHFHHSRSPLNSHSPIVS